MRRKTSPEQWQNLLPDVSYDIIRILVIQETLEESPSGLGNLRPIFLDGDRVERVLRDPSVLTPDRVRSAEAASYGRFYRPAGTLTSRKLS